MVGAMKCEAASALAAAKALAAAAAAAVAAAAFAVAAARDAERAEPGRWLVVEGTFTVEGRFCRDAAVAAAADAAAEGVILDATRRCATDDAVAAAACPSVLELDEDAILGEPGMDSAVAAEEGRDFGEDPNADSGGVPGAAVGVRRPAALERKLEPRGIELRRVAGAATVKLERVETGAVRTEEDAAAAVTVVEAAAAAAARGTSGGRLIAALRLRRCDDAAAAGGDTTIAVGAFAGGEGLAVVELSVGGEEGREICSRGGEEGRVDDAAAAAAAAASAT